MFLGNLFVLQLLYEHYEEFMENHFSTSFHKYFGMADNKTQIKEMVIKYLFDVKFTKDELKQVIMINENKMSEYELMQNQKEWEEYNITKGHSK